MYSASVDEAATDYCFMALHETKQFSNILTRYPVVLLLSVSFPAQSKSTYPVRILLKLATFLNLDINSSLQISENSFKALP